MLHSFFVESNGVSLRPLVYEDVEALRRWRNNAENTAYLRPLPYITNDMQNAWYEAYSHNSNEIAFAIIVEGAMIGSVSLYNFERERFEYGRLMIGSAAHRGRGLGYRSVALSIHIGFSITSAKECICAVHEQNKPGVAIENHIGFTAYGKRDFVGGGREMLMQVSEENFYICNGWTRKAIVEVRKNGMY